MGQDDRFIHLELWEQLVRRGLQLHLRLWSQPAQRFPEIRIFQVAIQIHVHLPTLQQVHLDQVPVVETTDFQLRTGNSCALAGSAEYLRLRPKKPPANSSIPRISFLALPFPLDTFSTKLRSDSTGDNPRCLVSTASIIVEKYCSSFTLAGILVLGLVKRNGFETGSKEISLVLRNHSGHTTERWALDIRDYSMALGSVL